MEKDFLTQPHAARLVGIVLLLAAPGPALAGFTLVTDPSQVGPHTSVTWDSLGPVGTQFTSPITISSGGSNLTITADSFVPGVGSSQTILLQDIGGSIYLSTLPASSSSSLTISFDQPIQAFGSVISARTGRSNTSFIQMEALGVDGTVLPFGSFALASSFNLSPARFDGYVGISSDQANIYQVRYSASALQGSGFGASGSFVQIGPLDFNSPTSVAVPAPSGFTLFVSGLAGALALLHGRNRMQGTAQRSSLVERCR